MSSPRWVQTTVESGRQSDLQAQAGLMRELRNYGVHPRPEATDHLERHFTDSGTAMLVFQTHSYLARLATSITTRRALNPEPEAPPGATLAPPST